MYTREVVLPSVLDVEEMAGAEWWLQDTDCDDKPKDFHTDANLQVTWRDSADGRGPLG